jgi:hypothetical protein
MGQKEGQKEVLELKDGKTRMWLTNDTIIRIKALHERLKPIHKYEIVESCVKFFSDKGYDPRGYNDDLPALELFNLKSEILKSNQESIKSSNDLRDEFVRFIRTHEKKHLNPVVTKLDSAVSILIEFLREQNMNSKPFDANIRKSDVEEKKPDWLQDFLKERKLDNNEIVVEDKNKNKDLLIKNERLEAENQRLIEQLKFIKSKIQTKKSTFGSTQYIVDLDEIELDDFLKK